MAQRGNAIYVSDGYDLISKKILINRMSLENLKNQIEFSKASAKLQSMSIKTAQEKMKLIEQLNSIMEKQLSEFCEIRQQECNDIYGYINEIDTHSQEFIDVINDCNKYEQAMLTLLPKIQHLESTIPAQQLITNYKAKEKPTAPTSYNCATNAMGFGAEPPDDQLPE